MHAPASIKTVFFGREAIVQDLVHGVLAPSQPLDFSLVGPKMIGKSRMLKHLADDNGPLKGEEYRDRRPASFEDGRNIIVGHFDCEWPEAKAHLTRYLSRQLRLQLEQQEHGLGLKWLQIDQAASPGQEIELIVRQLDQQHIRLVLLLDNFDQALTSDSITLDIINELRPLTKMLGLIVATEQPLHDLNPKLAASPLFNVMHQHFVGLLEPAATDKWLNNYSRWHELSADLRQKLREFSGGHPFLLARINDIFTELGPFLTDEQEISSQHWPIIELRLAEHGRPLFENIWRRLHTEPNQVALSLLNRLANGPIPIGALPPIQSAGMNWLINQAIVRITANQYATFSPLFTKFFLEQLELEQSPDAPLIVVPSTALDGLAPKEAELLHYFQQRYNVTVSFEQLLTDIWHQPDASPRRVQEAVRRLRNQLKKEQPPLGTIKSERGVGYRFVPHGMND